MIDDHHHDRKLRPGPGHSPDEVRASQRARLHEAMIELVDERGYEDVTVRRLSARAEVSTRTFYECFRGKQECLLGTAAAIMLAIARRVAEESAGVEDPEERLRLGLRAFTARLAEDPTASRLALVEASAAGLAFVERGGEMVAPFEAKLAACLARIPERTAAKLVVKAAAAGILRVVRARLLDGREAELPELVDPLHAWVMVISDRAVANFQRRAPAAGRAPGRADALIQGPPRHPDEDPERQLLLSAAMKLAARDGYLRLTGAQVSAEAGLAPSRFAAHFPDTDACFLACQQLLTERVLALAEQERTRATGWAPGVHRALAVLAASAAAEPGLARLAFQDISLPGLTGLQARERLLGLIVERFLASAPRARRPDPIAAEASLGAIWSLTHHCVTTGQAERLPALAPLLSHLALAPTIGPDAAADLIAGQKARHRD